MGHAVSSLGITPRFLEGLKRDNSDAHQSLDAICRKVARRYRKLKPRAFQHGYTLEDVETDVRTAGLRYVHRTAHPTAEGFRKALNRAVNTPLERENRRASKTLQIDTIAFTMQAPFADIEELRYGKRVFQVFIPIAFEALGEFGPRDPSRRAILKSFQEYRQRLDRFRQDRAEGRCPPPFEFPDYPASRHLRKLTNAILRGIDRRLRSPATPPSDVELLRDLYARLELPPGRGNHRNTDILQAIVEDFYDA